MKSYLEEFHNLKLFRSEEALNLVGNENSTKDLLYNYKKQKFICQVRRNLYVSTDLATKKSIATKFEIGSNICILQLKSVPLLQLKSVPLRMT
jgi:hypothetical protein